MCPACLYFGCLLPHSRPTCALCSVATRLPTCCYNPAATTSSRCQPRGPPFLPSPALPLPSPLVQPAGLKRDVLYCYDLELPPDFVPQPQASGARGRSRGGGGRAGTSGGAWRRRMARCVARALIEKPSPRRRPQAACALPLTLPPLVPLRSLGPPHRTARWKSSCGCRRTAWRKLWPPPTRWVRCGGVEVEGGGLGGVGLGWGGGSPATCRRWAC